MAARTVLLVTLAALLCASNGADARQLQQSSTADPSLISAALQYVLSDPSMAASLISTLVSNTGSNANLTTLINMAVSAIGNARPVVQNQLPAPVSSLSNIKDLNGLDTAIASRGATYVIQQLGSDKYSQAITGLKALLNPNGASTPSYISAFDNYDTALAFVQALGHSQDNNGDTNTVADTYLATLEDNKEADACIAAMPSLNGAPEATAVTDLYGKCCPVIKKALDGAPSLNGKSGLVNFLVSEQSNYNILSKCPATTS